MSRSDLTGLIVVCDLLICIAYAISIKCLKHYVIKTQRFQNQEAYQITDFAVEIKNLPSHKVFGSLENLKAKLHLHINRVLENQDQVMQSLTTDATGLDNKNT